MTRATLSDVLQPAMTGGYAVAGVVCQGWEDAQAYVVAAEAEGAPIILQAGPGARAHTPLPVLAEMFRTLADAASIPVVLHLDHANHIDECRLAIDEGFTSVMYDGSRLSIAENIDNTAEIVALARRYKVSTEGEIGFVGYARGQESKGTDAIEAGRFVRETGVDAVAVSIGNVHLQQDAEAEIDLPKLKAISARCRIPIVLHGGSGIPHDMRTHLATQTDVCKFNIGTELRMAFGAALRRAITENPGLYDRIELLSLTHDPLVSATRDIIRNLRNN
jgi:fructose-bisphosphate aldolase class II